MTNIMMVKQHIANCILGNTSVLYGINILPSKKFLGPLSLVSYTLNWFLTAKVLRVSSWANVVLMELMMFIFH